MYWSICRQSYIVSTLFFHNFVTIRLDYLTIIFHMTTLKESFRGQRMATIPESLLAKYKDDSLIGLLFLRKIGYFPHAKYHHVKKNDGCSYALLIHCTDGEGWVEIFHHTQTSIHNNSGRYTLFLWNRQFKSLDYILDTLLRETDKHIRSIARRTSSQRCFTGRILPASRTHSYFRGDILKFFHGLHTRIYGILIHVPLSLSGIFHIPRAIP